MDLHQLRVFRSAARNRGFTRAAEELHLSQSTVSLHIRELEAELESPLFLRVGRKVLLSPTGTVLLEYVERLLRDLKNAEMAVREMSAIERGTVHIGAGATTLMYRLPPLLAAYQARFPQIELRVRTGTTESLLQALEAQQLDLAIVMCPVQRAGLRVTPLCREELAVVLHRNHPAAHKATLTAGDLAHMRFILYEKHTAMQDLVDAWFRELGISPAVPMEMENIEAVKALVRSGLGVSILPLCAVAAAGGSDALKALRVKGHRLYRQLGLASLDADRLPNSIRVFSDMLCSHLAPA